MDKRTLDYSFPTHVAARALDEAMKNANSPLQKKAVSASSLVQRFYAWRKGSQLRQQEDLASTPIKSKTKEIAFRDTKARSTPPGVICANDNSRLQVDPLSKRIHS